MDSEVKEFIEKNITLIEENKWGLIYSKLMSTSFTGNFTAAVLAAGINPLEYLDYIPAYYMASSTVETVHIPDHIIKIGRSSFVESKIKNIKIPNSVKVIGPDAFDWAKELKDISIPASVERIEFRAFAHSGVENIAFEDGSKLKIIETRAFWGAENLKSIIIPKSVETIEYNAFKNTGRSTIFAETENKPDGWEKNWKPARKPVVWGYEEK